MRKFRMRNVICEMTLWNDSNPNPLLNPIHKPNPNPHQVSAASMPHINFRNPHTVKLCYNGLG